MSNELLFLFPYFLGTGIVVGFLSMLFGIGGGLVIVPAINLFLWHVGYSHNTAMKTAVATSLTTILFSSLNVLYRQNKMGNVPWYLIRQFLPFVLVGGLLGIFVATQVTGDLLIYLFLLFLLYIILYSWFNKDLNITYQFKDFITPSGISKASVGFVAGMLSILIGVGGNVLFVPYLRYHKCPMKNATAFTVAIMPFVAVLGSVGYLIEDVHLKKTTTVPYSLGYINLPILIFIVLGSLLGASVGQKLLKYMRDKFQAKAYFIFLMLIFSLMLESTGLFRH